MITLFGFLPFLGITLLSLLVGGFLTDYLNWWGW